MAQHRARPRLRSSRTPVKLTAPAAILFDLDGTLVDTVETRIEAWRRALEESGVPVRKALLARLIGSDGRYLARQMAEEAGLSLDADRLEAIDRLQGEIYDAINADPRPLPGARDLLMNIEARGVPWAIATSSRPEQVGVSVRALHLSRPPSIIDGSHVAHAKPSPDLLLHAAREVDKPPERCWYVGDSIWDMRAATAAHMVAIGVTAGAAVTASDLRAAGATIVIRGLRELVKFIPS